MVGVFALFGTLDSVALKQMGVGLAVAVALDATVIRGILLPATMKLLGDWNWWLPRRLAWLPQVSLVGEPPEKRDQGAIYGCLPDVGEPGRREPSPMLVSTASRLAAFAAALAVTGGAAAGVGAATDATPPFQDCLKVAAAQAGFGKDAMPDGGHGAAPMIEAVPGSDGRRSALAGLELRPLPVSL